MTTSALADLRRPDEERFGAKSALLGELIAGGIPVPPGFAISSDAYLAAVEGLELEGRTPDQCARAIRELPVPEDLRAEIAERYEELASVAGEPEPAVAVRSSAIGEDSEEATFAGQQETYLWVRGRRRRARRCASAGRASTARRPSPTARRWPPSTRCRRWG